MGEGFGGGLLGAKPEALGALLQLLNKNNAFLCIFWQNIMSHLPQGEGLTPPSWLRH